MNVCTRRFIYYLIEILSTSKRLPQRIEFETFSIPLSIWREVSRFGMKISRFITRHSRLALSIASFAGVNTMYPGTYFELLTILMLWRRSATTMPSHGGVAKVCATKIATSRGENIKTKWPPKSFFFCAPPLRRCGHFLNIVFLAKTKTATCRD